MLKNKKAPFPQDSGKGDFVVLGKVNYKSFVGTGLVPVRKTFAKPMSGGQGCFRNKVKVTIRCTPARARGTPGEGSPRQNSPPDCFASPPALPCKKEFRPVRRATKGAAFGLRRLLKKAGENFIVWAPLSLCAARRAVSG